MTKRILSPGAKRVSRRRMLTLSGGLGIGAAGLALVGCGGGDDDDASPSTSEPADEAPSGPNDSPPADLESVSELPPVGEVGAGTSVVNVTQNNDDVFSLTADPTSVPSGEVLFSIQNDHVLAHSFVVIRSNLETFDLTIRGFTIDPDQPGVEFVGQLSQIENPPREAAGLTLSLAPGRYLLSCLVDAHYFQFEEVTELQVT
jgi:hypothetical protein